MVSLITLVITVGYFWNSFLLWLGLWKEKQVREPQRGSKQLNEWSRDLNMVEFLSKSFLLSSQTWGYFFCSYSFFFPISQDKLSCLKDTFTITLKERLFEQLVSGPHFPGECYPVSISQIPGTAGLLAGLMLVNAYKTTFCTLSTNTGPDAKTLTLFRSKKKYCQ